MAGRLNDLDVRVSLNNSGLRRGLRQSGRMQQTYVQRTRRQFTGLGAALGRIRGLGGLGVGIGAVGGVAAAGAAVGRASEAGREFGRMSDLQRQTLTQGQRDWRAWSRTVRESIGRASVALETDFGRLLRAVAGPARERSEIDQLLRGQLIPFARQAPIGAVARGRDVQALTQIQRAQDEFRIRKKLINAIRQQREQPSITNPIEFGRSYGQRARSAIGQYLSQSGLTGRNNVLSAGVEGALNSPLARGVRGFFGPMLRHMGAYPPELSQPTKSF